MCWLNVLLILFSLVCLGHCDDKGIGGYGHHGHHLHFHEFYYLIFLAIKFKVILIIGSIWAFGLLGAKIFAAFKLADYYKKQNYFKEDHHEVVYSNPHQWDYGGAEIYGKSYGPVESYHSDISYDHPPSGGGDISFGHYAPSGGADFGGSAPAEVFGDGAHLGDYGNRQGRKLQEETTWYNKYMDKFVKIIRSYNVTELVFKEMNIKTEDCKRKFVCEAEFNAKQNFIVKSALNLLSDENYRKYKGNKTVSVIDECAKLNSRCQDNT